MKVCPTCKLRYPPEALQCFVHRIPLVVEQDPWLGAMVAGRYRVEGVIGAGGMATVYRARSTLNDRPVAIKMFRRELGGDARLKERFRREASSTRRLAHRNVVEILDDGVADDGTPFLVMEFLEGETLESRLKRERAAMPLEFTVRLGSQLAAGLARAHDFGVLHRDLKPENLFLCPRPDGTEILKILDFGIARSMADTRLTATGEIFGTPQYMAPERISSTDSGPAGDLYAVGCILFRSATGRLPFNAHDVTSFLLQHLRERPPSPRSLNSSVPPELDALILQCLEKEPARRPVDAHAIERVLQKLPGGAARPPTTSGSFPAIRLPPTKPAMALDQLKATSVGGMFTPASVSRWARRSDLLQRMVHRAFGNSPPAAVSTSVGRLRAAVSSMADVHVRWIADQSRIDDVSTRNRDARARFGRAMDALAGDLSAARQAQQSAQAAAREREEKVAEASQGFWNLHAEILAMGDQPVPGTTLLQKYRAAMEALRPAIPLAEIHRAHRGEVDRCDAEVRDLEFQLEALRTQLERVSSQGDDEATEIQRRLERAAAQLSVAEVAMVQDASALTLVLRGRSELDELFRELETDAA